MGDMTTADWIRMKEREDARQAGMGMLDVPSFYAAGNVNASSINAPAPDCGPKSRPVLDANGQWQCQPVVAGGGFGWATWILLAIGAWLAWQWWNSRGKHIWRSISGGGTSHGRGDE